MQTFYPFCSIDVQLTQVLSHRCNSRTEAKVETLASSETQPTKPHCLLDTPSHSNVSEETLYTWRLCQRALRRPTKKSLGGKLRAWSSVDGDDSNDDSYDEDFIPANEPPSLAPEVPPYLRDLLHSQVCQHLGLRGPCCEGAGRGDRPSPTSTDTICSSLCSLDEQHPLLRDLTHHCGINYGNAAELAAKILSALQGGEELLLARLQRVGQGVRGGGDFNSLSAGLRVPARNGTGTTNCIKDYHLHQGLAPPPPSRSSTGTSIKE
ncbi:uncharacterized protein [Salvelinus sp. IW2-2015]|uniref:uncharacterized protein n=1 Tax=Salvelinus sp. IW2-2015 TaxID=2691554 RepID=UPI0038D475AB